MPEDAEPIVVSKVANSYRALPVEEQAKLLAQIESATADARAVAELDALAHADAEAARNLLRRNRR